MPYGSAQIHAMTPVEKFNLDKLLGEQDPDLLDWFLGKSTPADSASADAVHHVLTFSNDRDRARES